MELGTHLTVYRIQLLEGSYPRHEGGAVHDIDVSLYVLS